MNTRTDTLTEVIDGLCVYSSIPNMSEECQNVIVTLSQSLDLGNNFTYQHFIDALSDDQAEALYSNVAWDLDDNISIHADGNCGRVILHTCGSDFSDHIKPRYDAI